MKKTVFLMFISLAIFLAGGTSASAQKTSGQTKITGRVIDSETGQGEPGAIIQFIADGDTKPLAFTSTDTEGNFVQLLPEGKTYQVSISNLGRKTIEKTFEATPGKEVNLGELLIEDDKNELAAAAVVAQRPLVKMEVDKMTYNVEDDIDSKSYTVLDMLRKVPMVTVDAQDNITVNGSSSFLVTVDGKPNQMLTTNASKVFKMMPAAAIKKIEVVTNPGVKYDAEGVGGVLNLVTEAGASGGSSSVGDGEYGNVNLTAGNTNVNAGAMLTAQRGKISFSLNGNVGYNWINNIKSQTSIENGTGETGMAINTTAAGKMRAPFAWGDFSFSYEPDTLNLISVNVNGMYFGQKSPSLSTTSSSLPGLLTPATSYTRDNLTKNKSGNFDIGADWQHKFANAPGKTLTISYRGGLSPDKSYDNSRFDGDYAIRQQLTDGRTSSDSHTLQADYTGPLWGGTLSSGFKYTYRKNKSVQDMQLAIDGSLSPYPEGSVDYLYTNKIGAAYTEYSLTRGKVGIKAGARYEHTWQDIEYRNKAGEDFSTDYGFLIPTASLQYNIGMAQNIGLSYNVRISRPGISYLNPYRNTSDPTQVQYGNPDLDVAKNHNLSLVYNFYSPIIMLSATLNHSGGNSGISQYSYADENVIYTTYGNILKSRNTGLRMFVNLNLGRTTRVYLNGSINYDDLRSDVLNLKASHWNSNLFAGAQQTIFWDLRLSENLILNPKQYNLQGYTSGFQAGVLGISKSFLNDKLNFSVNVISPLNKDGKINFKTYSENYNYRMNSAVKIPLRQVMLSVSWSFGAAGSAKVKKADRSVENDDILNKPASNEGIQNGQISTGM